MPEKDFTKSLWLRQVGLFSVLLGTAMFIISIVHLATNLVTEIVYTRIAVGIWASIPIIATGSTAIWLAKKPFSRMNDYFLYFLSLCTFFFPLIIFCITILEILATFQIGTRYILPTVILILDVAVFALFWYSFARFIDYRKEIEAENTNESTKESQPIKMTSCHCETDPSIVPQPRQPLLVSMVSCNVYDYRPKQGPIQPADANLPIRNHSGNDNFGLLTSVATAAPNKCPKCPGCQVDAFDESFNKSAIRYSGVSHILSYPAFGTPGTPGTPGTLAEQDRVYGLCPQLGGINQHLIGNYTCSGNI